ncbi:MAG: hypothetical protein KDN22_12400 [Verrucomicrobiae bacterium]|nr:hypothetical protein [Verrucomicrobiae bacterium]
MFNIHPGEGAKVLAFTFLTVLLNAGLGLGMSAADSLFLSHVGAAHLPVVYLGAPLVLLAYIPVSVWLMGCIGKTGLFRFTLIIMAVGGVAVWGGAALPEGILPGQSLYYAAKIYTGVWYVALYSLLWSFIDSYFDILDAKRLFSLFAAGTSLGMMLGGAMVVGLVDLIGVEQLFLVWAAISLATVPFLAMVTRRWKSLESDAHDEEGPRIGFIDQWRIVVSTARQSKFLWVFGTVLVTTLVINTLCEFQYMRIFEEGRTEAEIAGLFGRLYFGVNAFNLMMNLFLFNRLIATFGVRNTALIQPVVYIASFSFFFISSGFGAAVAGFVAFHGVMASIEYNNQNLLFNALPERGKAEVRAIVEGIIEPMAVALAGLFLVIVSSRISADAITVSGLLLALFAFCAALALRAEYVTAMVAKLKDAWLSFSSEADQVVALSSSDVKLLRDAAASADLNRALTAAQLLWRSGDRDTALDALADAIGNDATAPPEVMETLRILARTAEEQNHAALRILEQWPNRSGIGGAVREELERWQNVEQAAGGGSGQRNDLSKGLTALTSTPVEEREYLLNKLMPLLDGDSVEAVPPLLETVMDGDGAVRMRALAALARVGDPDCIPPLLSVGAQFSPAERRQVEDLLTTIGLRSVPNLVSLLTESDCCHAGRSIGARALSTLAFPQLEALSDRILSGEIDRAYRYLFSEASASKGDASIENLPFLARLYRDLRQESVDYVLEMLSLTGRMTDHEMIAASLRSSNAKERANAIETIEQGCERAVFKKLLPLIDGRTLERAVSSAGGGRGQLESDQEDARFLVESVRRGGELECAAAFHSLWGTGQRGAGLNEITTRNQHGSGASPLLAEMISTALKREVSQSSSELPNTIEKVQILAGSAFFSQFRMTEILDLALQAEVGCSVDGSTIYEAGDSCNAVYVVMSGAIEDGEQTVIQGGLVGGECLAGAAHYVETAVSRGARVMVIPQSAIWRASCIHPNIALALLAHQVEVDLYVA